MPQTKGDEKFTILTGGLHLLTDELEKWGVDQGHTTTRLVAKARRELVAKLNDKGLSQRQIAALVGTSQMTVSRDMAETNVSDVSENVSDEEEPQPSDEEAEQFPPSNDEQRWQSSLLNMAEEISNLTSYWNDKFNGWQDFAATQHMITQANRAMDVWAMILTHLDKQLPQGESFRQPWPPTG